MNEICVKAPQAFHMLSVSETTGYRLIKSGELQAIKIGQRWVVPLTCIEQFIRSKSA